MGRGVPKLSRAFVDPLNNPVKEEKEYIQYNCNMWYASYFGQQVFVFSDRSLFQWKMFRNRFIELFAIVKFRCVWQSRKTYAVLPVSSKIRTIVNRK